MPRTTYRKCKFCGDFHDVDNWPDNHREWIPDNRNHELAAPSVISDNLDYVVNHASGERFTSKRALRADYRARGVVEVGNEDPGAHRVKPDRKKQRRDVKDAVERAVNTITQKTPTETRKQVRKKKRRAA